MFIIGFIVILINIIASAWWMIHGNILFHTDIARDFLLIEDIVVKKHLTLIGPRSGAIPGVFHGPLWLYLNLPAFLVGKGNPVVVGWFWVFLSVLSIYVVYWVGKKMFSQKVGLLSAVLIATIQAQSIKSLFNPFGALILSPLFFYLLITYFEKKQIKILIWAMFILGLLIQFQMAFGIPLLILSFIAIFFFLVKNKLLRHLSALSVLLIPLSTYIVFDLRHSFLQLKSVNDYLFGTQSHGKLDITFFETLSMRIRELFINGVGMLTQENLWLNIIIGTLFVFLVIKLFRKKELKFNHPYLLFIYFYFGFWIISLAFKGPVWSYYFWPFLLLLVIIFSSFVKYINKYLFYALFVACFALVFYKNITDIVGYNPNYKLHDESSWIFNYNVAKSIYANAGSDFGYFIFTPDLYGYYPRYAMNFTQKQFPNIKAYPFEKKALTYLLIAPAPEYGKDPQSVWYQKNINSSSWKTSDIKIDKNPESVVEYQNGFRVEKYLLTEKEVKIPPNPYLIDSLIFR